MLIYKFTLLSWRLIVKKLFLISAMLFSITSVSFGASLTSMSQSEAQNALSDKTITTISAATLNDKIISDSYTGFFSKDGKITGKFAKKPANDPQKDTGTWQVKNDGQFCVTYQHWNNGKERCVLLYKLDNAILVVNSNNGFESLILNKDIKSGNKV